MWGSITSEFFSNVLVRLPIALRSSVRSRDETSLIGSSNKIARLSLEYVVLYFCAHRTGIFTDFHSCDTKTKDVSGDTGN